MNQRNIRVSVIMACHNSAAYLDEAIGSILTQTFTNLQLIVIDDCSTDNSLQIAQSYRKQDDRVAVIPLSVNSGPSVARNAGIQTASGEWLGVLDSDDVAMPSRFEEQMRLADSDKDLVMIGSSSIFINAKGHIIEEHKYPTRHQALVKRLSSKRAFPPHSSLIYRRTAVEKVLAFNSRYVVSEDCDLWLRLSEIGNMASIDKPLVRIRKHERNLSNLEKEKLLPLFGFAAAVCHFLRIHGDPDPSAGSDDAAWQTFLEWLEKRMIEEGVFTKRKAWADARAEYFAAGDKLTGALRFGGHLLKSGHAGVLVWTKFFGSSQPESLAREWMKRSCEAL